MLWVDNNSNNCLQHEVWKETKDVRMPSPHLIWHSETYAFSCSAKEILSSLPLSSWTVPFGVPPRPLLEDS